MAEAKPPHTIARLLNHAKDGDKVRSCGIVEKTEHREGDSMIVIRDGSTMRTLTAKLAPSKESAGLSQWTTVELQGTWKSQAAYQLETNECRVLGESDAATNPLNDTKSGSIHPHLRLRTPWTGLLMRFRSATVAAISTYFATHEDGPFHQVHHPVITHTDCEGGAEVFPVLSQQTKRADALHREDYFGGRRYLTVTAAIHGEAFAMGLDRVWMLTPSFRAERVSDNRHLSEFYMLEIAINYVESLDPLLRLCEDFLRSLVQSLRQSAAGQELMSNVGRSDTTSCSQQELSTRWDLLVEPDWPRITHAEAVVLMQQAEGQGKASFEVKPGPGVDLSEEHEMFLLEHFKRPIFVTHYPTKIRLFSAKQSPPPPPGGVQTTESVDLLLPGIAEVFSGGLREHRLDQLVDAMRPKGLLQKRVGGDKSRPAYPYVREDEDLDTLEWFADLRRWGTTPHGGFGIGFERLLYYLTGAESTKDVIAFPRSYQSCAA